MKTYYIIQIPNKLYYLKQRNRFVAYIDNSTWFENKEHCERISKELEKRLNIKTKIIEYLSQN